MANKPPFTSWSELNREETGLWRKFISALVRSGLFPGGSGTGGGMEQHSNEWHTPDMALASSLSSYELLTNKDTSTSLGTSDTKYPSQKAVKEYVDTAVSGVGGGSGDARLINDGRLERASDTSLTWTGYEIGLWDATAGAWVGVIPSSTPTAANTATDLDSSALTSDANYDVFAEYVSATAFNPVFKKFSSGNTRAVTPALWQGRYCYDNTTDAGKSRLWLGTIRLRNDGGTAKFTFSATQPFIWNKHNQTTITAEKYLSGTSWTYNSNTRRYLNNDSTNKIELLLGLADNVYCYLKMAHLQSSANTNAQVELSVDGISSAILNITSGWNQYARHGSQWKLNTTPLGYHTLDVVELSDENLATCTFQCYGQTIVSARYQG